MQLPHPSALSPVMFLVWHRKMEKQKMGTKTINFKLYCDETKPFIAHKQYVTFFGPYCTLELVHVQTCSLAVTSLITDECFRLPLWLWRYKPHVSA